MWWTYDQTSSMNMTVEYQLDKKWEIVFIPLSCGNRYSLLDTLIHAYTKKQTDRAAKRPSKRTNKKRWKIERNTGQLTEPQTNKKKRWIPTSKSRISNPTFFQPTNRTGNRPSNKQKLYIWMLKEPKLLPTSLFGLRVLSSWRFTLAIRAKAKLGKT